MRCFLVAISARAAWDDSSRSMTSRVSLRRRRRTERPGAFLVHLGRKRQAAQSVFDPIYSVLCFRTWKVLFFNLLPSGSAEPLIEKVKEDLGAFVERLKKVHEVLFNL